MWKIFSQGKWSRAGRSRFLSSVSVRELRSHCRQVTFTARCDSTWRSLAIFPPRHGLWRSWCRRWCDPPKRNSYIWHWNCQHSLAVTRTTKLCNSLFSLSKISLFHNLRVGFERSPSSPLRQACLGSSSTASLHSSCMWTWSQTKLSQHQCNDFKMLHLAFLSTPLLHLLHLGNLNTMPSAHILAHHLIDKTVFIC